MTKSLKNLIDPEGTNKSKTGQFPYIKKHTITTLFSHSSICKQLTHQQQKPTVTYSTLTPKIYCKKRPGENEFPGLFIWLEKDQNNLITALSL